MSMRIARPVMLNHIASPYGISVISTLVFGLAWILPGHFYASLMGEPDLMFLDPELLLFFLLCVLGFWVGLLTMDFFSPSPSLVESNPRFLKAPGVLLALPLIATTIFSVLVGLELFRQNPDLLTRLLNQEGQAVKSEVADTQFGILGWGATMHTVVLWWVYWRLWNVSSEEGGLRRQWFLWLVFGIGFLVQIAESMLLVSRSDLMPVFGGLAILYLIKKIKRDQIKIWGVLKYLLFFMIAIVLLFVSFGFYRGEAGIMIAFQSFLGYTLSSYNRMAALVHGTMHYPFAGRGLYLFSSLSTNHTLRQILPFKDAFRWPEYQDLWASEFQAPSAAGLDSRLIWSGAFGYLFSDFGWFTPMVLIGYGLVYGFIWKQMKRGTVIGIVLYPWLAFSALAWFTGNMAFAYQFPFFLIAAFFLMAYEKLLVVKI